MWQNVYRDEHVLVRADEHGRVGVWHGGPGAWRLVNVSPGVEPQVGFGPTMHEARENLRDGLHA
jgi:hypothetical protein